MDLPLEPIRTLWTCTQIEPLLDAHLDRELTRVEEQRVDQHLDTCSRCRARREHLEALSGALKAWESGTVTPVPPDLRLRHAVLARVAETSHQRRADDRVLRLTHFAMAACVLLALGLGFLLGARYETPLDTRPGASIDAVAFSTDATSLPEPQLGLPSGVDLPGLQPKTTLAGLAPREGLGPLPAAISRFTARQDAVVRWILAKGVILEREAKLHLATGEEVVALPGTPDGTLVFVTRDSLRSPHLQGLIAKWQGRRTAIAPASVAPPPRATVTTPPAVTGAPTGKTVRDLLAPMQGLLVGAGLTDEAPDGAPDGAPSALRTLPVVMRWQALEARGIRRSAAAKRPALRSRDGTSSASEAEVLDPLTAQEDGHLTFRDYPHDARRVVVRVSGNASPIFIPAGQILAGGVTDRVAATPLWIPASPSGELSFALACLPIRRGPERAAEHNRPHLTRWIVGPSLRGLLMADPTPGVFLDAAARQFQAAPVAHRRFGEFSLLDVYRSAKPRTQDARREWDRFLRADAWAGFVFSGAAGDTLGVEIVRFRGPAAGKLLARLWVSYQFETALRPGIPAGDERTLARPAGRLADVLRRVRQSTAGFQGKTDEQLLRVSHATLESGRLRFGAAELGRRDRTGAVTYGPLHVSGVPDFDAIRAVNRR